MLAVLAGAGATQVEPGHGLTGTTPLHAIADLPERPAVVYLTEVSHLTAARPSASAAGSISIRSSPDYALSAIVSREPTASPQALEAGRDPGARGDRLLRHDLDASGPAETARRRQRRVRLPAAGLRDPRLCRRRLAAFRAARRSSRRSTTPSGGRCGLAVMSAAATRRRRLFRSSGIRKTFGGVVAIEDFSLDVRAGEIVALVGDNGAGKSTLVKIVAGVQPATRGACSSTATEDAFADPSAAQAQRHAGRLPGPRARRQPARLHEHVSRPRTRHRSVPPARPARA